MESTPYIVSARKYRPSNFKDVVGQSSVSNTLINAIQNKTLAQAFLFCGPRGVGKTTCARILAKAVNADDITKLDEISDDNFNVFELDAASNNSVDDIRSLIDQVRIAPAGDKKYKVYIIDEVHMLSASAFNAFLKTLEEPPSYAIFVLATTEKHKILPTILSRCQVFDFNRISTQDITDHLKYIAEKENVKAEEEALHIIAQKADGGLRDALSIFDQMVSFSGGDLTYKSTIENLNMLDLEYYFQLTEQLSQGNYKDILLETETILSQGFDGHHFIGGLAKHLRDLLVAKDDNTCSLLDVSEGFKTKYQEQAKNIDVRKIFSWLKIIGDAEVGFKQSKHKRLHLEVTLIKLCDVALGGEKKK